MTYPKSSEKITKCYELHTPKEILKKEKIILSKVGMLGSEY